MSKEIPEFHQGGQLLTVKAEPFIVKKDPVMVIMVAAKPLTFFRAKPLTVVKDKAEL
jgi:hypothetical protein